MKWKWNKFANYTIACYIYDDEELHVGEGGLPVFWLGTENIKAHHIYHYTAGILIQFNLSIFTFNYLISRPSANWNFYFYAFSVFGKCQIF